MLDSSRNSEVPTGDPGGRIMGLDGIRAFAVSAVLVYHLLPGVAPGGFVGVDVFFGLSGFLITTLLLREIRRSGRINLIDFWKRRFRRLLPAVTLVLIVVFPAAWLVHRDLTVDAGRQIFGTLTFTTNWLEIFAGSSYFDQTAPLLMKNLWSLAIEEQFYWLWPIVLVVLVRLTGGMRSLARTASGARAALAAAAQRRMVIVLVAALISMILMAVLFTPGEDATRVYYGTDTHLFGLALGVGLAFLRSAPDGGVLANPKWRRWALLVGVAALAGLVGLCLLLSEDSTLTYRGGLQLANLLSVLLLAAVVTPSARTGGPHLLTRVLELKPLVYVGERSYGIYLWHWPILCILLELFPTAPDTTERAIVVSAVLVITFLIAEASFRFVETPIRRLGMCNSVRAVWARARDGVGAMRAAWISAIAALAALAVATAAVAFTAPDVSETAAVIHAKEAEIEAERQKEIERVANLGDRSMPEGKDISAHGDSIVVTAKDGLGVYFPEIDINAKSIRRWGDGVAALKADLEEGRVRRAVIVDYGTNAGIEDEAEVRAFLDALGEERMIVVVNIASVSDWVPEVNAKLDEIVADYPNAIVADWNGAIAKQPELLQADRIHPDLTGAYLYADVVRGAFAELSERLTGERVELPPAPAWPEATTPAAQAPQSKEAEAAREEKEAGQ